MTSPYVLTFSDPTNVDTITILPVPQGPGINNSDTSLSLVGPGYQNYGLPVAQNFLKLLENFAGPNQPENPIKGQLWYDTSVSGKPVLRINNGNIDAGRWPSANGIYQQSTDPTVRYTNNIIEGDVWVDTANNQLKIRFSDAWTVVGPSVQSGSTKSGSEAVIVESTSGDTYPIIKNWVNGSVVEIISYNAFTPRTVIDGFATIKIGTNITTKVSAKYNGLAEKASALEVSLGVLIKASEVLTNNAASQTLTGELHIQSANGLYVAPNSTNSPIRLYTDLVSSATIDFLNTSPASTLKVGIGTSSYLKFNSGYSSVGINTSPISTSPALEVNGGARFSKLVTINTNTDIALSVVGGAAFGGNISATGMIISGLTTSTGALALGSSGGSGTIIVPGNAGTYDIGSGSNNFRNIYASDFYAINYHGTFTGSASSLSIPRVLGVTGQVTATTVTFDGSSNVTFATTLTRNAIDSQSSTSTAAASHTLMVLNTATNTTALEKISKVDFLSDIYSSIFTTGMIIPFSTSTNIPSGFLVCDNRSASAYTYASLYALIGTTYGSAGAGTFRTPSMSTSTLAAPGTYVTYIIKT
jgi:hypothetical protein